MGDMWGDITQKAKDTFTPSNPNPVNKLLNPVKQANMVKDAVTGKVNNGNGNPYVAPDTKAQDFLSKNNAHGVAAAGGDISDWWHKVIGAGAGGGGGGGIFGSAGGDLDKIAYADAIKKSMGGQTFAEQYLPGLIQQMQAGAAGHGPGAQLAQNMINQGERDAALRGASSIASTKGINPAIAAKMAGDQQAQAQQAAVQQGATAGLQDQWNSQNQLGNVINAGTQGQNQNLATLIQGQTGQNDAIAKIVAAQNAAKAGMFGGVMNGLGGALGNPSLMNGIFGGGDAAGLPAAGAEQGFGAGASTTGGGVAADVAPEAIEAASSTALHGQSPGQAAAQGKATPLWNGVSNTPAAPIKLKSYGIGPSTKNSQPAAAFANAGNYFSRGGKVHGKAKVQGDSYENDTVEAKLSPGEIVVPRSAADDPDKAHRFIDAIMDKKKARKGYGGVLSARREVEELKKRIASLESRAGGAA